MTLLKQIKDFFTGETKDDNYNYDSNDVVYLDFNTYFLVVCATYFFVK